MANQEGASESDEENFDDFETNNGEDDHVTGDEEITTDRDEVMDDKADEGE